jgi:hypothetical protein
MKSQAKSYHLQHQNKTLILECLLNSNLFTNIKTQMKKLIFFATLVCSMLAVQTTKAQVSKTINVNTPGSLSTILTETEKSTITNLTITGVINASDFELMSFNMPLLSVLDLSVVEPANEIPESAFDECSNLTSIILPSTITAIGESAFNSCSGLKNMVIPKGVTAIQSSTFDYCTNLKSVSIPSSVTSIGEYAFEECSSLESITLPSSLHTIGEEAFLNCTSLISITIPSSVIDLGDAIFSGCDNLKTLIISEGVTTISRWMFDLCKSLTTVTLPSSITIIKESAFNYCTGLKTINIPPSVITIEDNAFVDCTALTSITIPSSVKSIGRSSFSDCTSLTSVIISEGVLSIGHEAFNNCIKLTSITIPSTVSSTGWSAFYNCKGLTSVVLKEGVDTISQNSFWGCQWLNTIVIPSTVSSIERLAFSECHALNSIYVYSIIPIGLKNDWSSPFVDVDKTNCKLYVPFGTKKDYQVAEKWKDFKNIVEMPGFYLSSTSVNLAPVLDRKDSITITSNIAWTASSDQKWLTINPTSGTGIGKLTFTATENTVNLSRIAIVTVSAKDVLSQIITVTQASVTGVATLGVSSTSVSITNEANSLATVNVTSNAIWSASSNQSWLTVSPASGTGNGTLTFTATANPTTTARMATVTVSATGVASQTIIVTQAAGTAVLIVSSNTLSMIKEANGTTSINIISNTEWIVTSDQPWLIINPTSGKGNWILSFYAAENTTNISRTAIVTFSATGAVSQIVTVTQASAIGVATLEVSSTTVSIAKEEKSLATVEVTSNATWSASSNQTWLTINPASGTGNGKLTFTATANPTTTERTAIVTVSATGVASQTVTIIQEAGTGNGVSYLTDKDVKLYPNPVSDVFHFEGIEGVTKLVLSDLNGKVRLSKEIVEHENISVSSLPKGLYIVTVTTKNGKTERKLVKE